MNVLLDTNIVLDVLLRREPWVEQSMLIWQAADEGRITGYVAATSLTNIFYIARKLPTGRDSAFAAVRDCLRAFDICVVDRAVLESALSMSGHDFEDNVQIACAQAVHLDVIVSRDVDGFRQGPVPALTPTDLLARLGPPPSADQPPAP